MLKEAYQLIQAAMFWTGTLALARKERDSHVEQDFLTGYLWVHKGEVMGLNHCHAVLQNLNKHIRARASTQETWKDRQKYNKKEFALQ